MAGKVWVQNSSPKRSLSVVVICQVSTGEAISIFTALLVGKSAANKG